MRTHESKSSIHCNTIAATSSASAISFASRAAAHSESVIRFVMAFSFACLRLVSQLVSH